MPACTTLWFCGLAFLQIDEVLMDLDDSIVRVRAERVGAELPVAVIFSARQLSSAFHVMSCRLTLQSDFSWTKNQTQASKIGVYKGALAWSTSAVEQKSSSAPNVST